jgi:hypothetical protein
VQPIAGDGATVVAGAIQPVAGGVFVHADNAGAAPQRISLRQRARREVKMRSSASILAEAVPMRRLTLLWQ